MSPQEEADLRREWRKANEAYHDAARYVGDFALKFKHVSDALSVNAHRVTEEDIDELPISRIKEAIRERDAAKSILDEIAGRLAGVRPAEF